MNTINSTYRGNITSKTNSTTRIISLSHLDIASKSKLDIVSYAKTYHGADEIAALNGVFSACKFENWKDEKTMYLKSNH